jgi:multimeric flavodoxin WrbA
MTAIVINGSLKKRGRVGKLCKEFGVPIIHLVDGIENAYREIKKADVIVFATPVLWFNVSSLMKELLERLPESPRYPLFGKTAYFFAVCDEDGAQQAINLMMGPLNHMGFAIPPHACLFYNTNMATKSELKWQVKDIGALAKKLRQLNK